jgi:hypothetical protein
VTVRFELGGYGGPIPNIALPDPKLSGDMPIQSLVLGDGTSFEKANWVALGYTHYEVWCVGAAGGMGAEVGDSSRELVTTELVTMPDWMWENAIQNEINSITFNGQTSFPVYEFSTVPGHEGEVVVRYITPREQAILNLERYNPAHLTQVNHHHDPEVITNRFPSIGGGGGGGGLHVMSGELANLPDSVPVVVGIAGIDALPAQINSPDPYDPYAIVSDPNVYQVGPGYYWYTHPIERDIFYFQNQWPPVAERTLLLPGQSGGDGGASAFGDICMASGGKGGGPAIVWVANTRMFAAHGGEGGVGGQLTAGGGAAGSTDSAKSGKDGTWDGTVGQGGGGGRGGMSEVKAESYSTNTYESLRVLG